MLPAGLASCIFREAESQADAPSLGCWPPRSRVIYLHHAHATVPCCGEWRQVLT